MGTKNNPGSFDCYAVAEPDEPMFVLLGRDQDAPDLVEEWVKRRIARDEIREKLSNALDCAEAMRSFFQDRFGKRCQDLAPKIVVEFGITEGDARKLLRVVNGDLGKARRAAILVKHANVPVSVIASAIALGCP